MKIPAGWFNDHELYDGLSVAAAEVRDAIESDFSIEAINALKKLFEEKYQQKKIEKHKKQSISIEDMPKIECPFIRKVIDGNYIVTPEINPGYEWVFNDDTVIAIEKLHGTNVSIIMEDGVIKAIFNRTGRVPFFCKGKRFIIDGLLESYDRGYMEFLEDGQHFGELIGEKVNGNPYKIKGHLWIPFKTYARKHLKYKSFGKYPKNFEAFSEWFKTLMPLYHMQLNQGDQTGFVEGIVFTHPDGRMAKLRKDMWPWFSGPRHKEEEVEKNGSI
jgi:hypothetical protein